MSAIHLLISRRDLTIKHNPKQKKLETGKLLSILGIFAGDLSFEVDKSETIIKIQYIVSRTSEYK
jgi:hypothetical protein